MMPDGDCVSSKLEAGRFAAYLLEGFAVEV